MYNNVFYPDSAGIGSHNIILNEIDKWGCENSDTQTTIIYPMPDIFIGKDTSICIGDTLIITMTGDFGMYGWLFTSTINTSIPVSPVADSSFIGWIMSSHNCVSFDTINVGVNSLPVVSFTGLDSTYCNSGQPDTLHGIPSGGVFSGVAVRNSSLQA